MAYSQERVSTVEKGSFLVFPKIEIRWDSDGQLIQDTFVDLTNDFPQHVFVRMQFVNGDPDIGAVVDGTCQGGFCDDGSGDLEGCSCEVDDDCYERAHFSDCRGVDTLIQLTQNEPTYWSAATGNGNEGFPRVAPFTILDPGNPPGRPDPDNPCQRVLRGFILAWAVDANGEQISWNHLKGDAIVVDYQNQAAWEYNAYAFQVHSVGRGELVWPAGTSPAEIVMDGTMYDYVFDELLLDFYAEGSSPFSYGDYEVSVESDLTLLPMDIDIRQDGDGPVTTKVKADIWNENEVQFSGTERCITCWDQTLLVNWALRNHFLWQNLQTDKGKAHLNGIASPNVCGDESVDVALLGVVMKRLNFFTGSMMKVGKAGMNLPGFGTQEARVIADLTSTVPDEAEDGTRGGSKATDPMHRIR